MVRDEIDTEAPFRSVKDVVTLFNEQIHHGENYLKEIGEKNKEENGVNSVFIRSKSIEAELVEVKESLKKAEEEKKVLSQNLETLTEELEKTKEKLKSSLLEYPQVEDDIKFVEQSTVKGRFDQNEVYGDDYEDRFERRRSVKFANPPLLTKVIVNKDEKKKQVRVKNKMKPLVPLAAWLFARNRST